MHGTLQAAVVRGSAFFRPIAHLLSRTAQTHMPTIFSAKLDGSEAVRLEHISLVVFYLRQARSRAKSAASLPKGEEQFAEALLAVVLAALCLESFANEWGEEVLESSELADFLRCRRKFQNPEGVGSVAWKLKTVFERKWGHALLTDSGILLEVDALFEMRNALVHCKLSESAAKSFLPPPAQLANPETGEIMTVFDFVEKPTRFEEPLVWRVNSAAAARAYNTALRVVKLWNEKAGAPAGALAAHTELPES